MERKRSNQPSRILAIATVFKFAFAALILGLGLTVFAVAASAATLTAGSCGSYATIQDAVNAAAAGDTVRVCPGTYQELVKISKNINLEGIVIFQPTSGVVIPIKYPTIIYPPRTEGEGDNLCDDGFYCPQILVDGSATVEIANLTLDGSNFSQPSCTPSRIPTGVLFLNSGGAAASITSMNHSVHCPEDGGYVVGDGIDVLDDTTGTGPFSVKISNNTISNFGTNGIYVTGTNLVGGSTPLNLTGSIAHNKVTTTPIAPGPNGDDYLGIVALGVNAFTISGNSVSLPTQYDGNATGIELEYSQKISVGNNSVTNFDIGVQSFSLDSSELEANNILHSSWGIFLGCSSDNIYALNSIVGLIPPPENSETGVFVSSDCLGSTEGSDDNKFISNSIDGFCAGVLSDSPLNVGNTYTFNAFVDIGPGTDIMQATSCP